MGLHIGWLSIESTFRGWGFKDMYTDDKHLMPDVIYSRWLNFSNTLVFVHLVFLVSPFDFLY